MATNPTSVMSQSTASPMNRSQKRKATTDTDASYSPASIC
ncbi:unnamed protein product, partial [Rotaria socialis]